MAGAGRTKHLKREAFLAAYSEVGNLAQAAEIAGVSRRIHYYWMSKHPDYPALFRHAEEQACDRLEQEARRRAIYGVKESVYYRGEVCGTVQKYSDILLIFLMKGHMPEKYKDRGYVEQVGPGGGPVEMRLQVSRIAELSPEEKKTILTELRVQDEDPVDNLEANINPLLESGK